MSERTRISKMTENHHKDGELASTSRQDIPEIPGNDLESTEALGLEDLTAGVRDQDEIERDITRQANELLTQQANEKDEKRLRTVEAQKSKLIDQVRKIEARLNGSTSGSSAALRMVTEMSSFTAQIESYEEETAAIKQRIEDREASLANHEGEEQRGNKRLPNETQRDFLIRTGKITPFSKLVQARPYRTETSLQDALLNAEAGEVEDESVNIDLTGDDPRSHRVLQKPGFTSSDDTGSSGGEKGYKNPRKRARLSTPPTTSAKSKQPEAEFRPTSDDDSNADRVFSVEDESPTTTPYSDDEDEPLKRKSKVKETSGVDDGNERVYRARLDKWVARRKEARRRHGEASNSAAAGSGSSETKEWNLPHPNIADSDLGEGFRLPGDIHPLLFDYQKIGVQWLWELYSQNVGGIVGDEMGLGKTIQIIAFLAGLHYSRKLTKPVLVVAPATLMKQWVNEFHTWWPAFRVSILHSSGSGMDNLAKEAKVEDRMLSQRAGTASKRSSKFSKSAKKLVDSVVDQGHILVTTYSGLQTYAELLIPINWEYAVLDEGHKIRNPNAAVTIYSKELRTANRVILSGTPIQNNLVELWSLFDFIFPMRLGNLVDFKEKFDIPIRIGGYANASSLQIQTANHCAETLKDAISPYLLQRMKVDVAADLPKKSERVLFCKLTRTQREAYENFLNGGDMKSVLAGTRQVLYGIDLLRKICNHPDLVDHKTLSKKPEYDYGVGAKSGKMVVVKELLKLWKKDGHKALLFAQHRIMLDILEKYVKTIPGLKYRRMDGNTPIGARQSLVDDFNNNPDVHVFLLTTKVGGLGTNLTGADRVIIYDPDWNPSTDIQANERAWRLGQKRDVEVYRLLVAGTIEEKIFHRQIFKQFLTNKVLKDPKQRHKFQMQDLHDLFSLGGTNDTTTETSKMFEGSEINIHGDAKAAKKETRLADDEARVGKLAGVAALGPAQQSGEEEAAPGVEGEAAGPGQDHADKRLLEKLFARSGVHSALEHDQIVGGRRVVAADPKIIEAAARKVAAEAAESLKRAHEVAKATPAGVPTWTGAYGTAGRPTTATTTATATTTTTKTSSAPSHSASVSTGVLGDLRNRRQPRGGVANSGGLPSSSGASANSTAATAAADGAPPRGGLTRAIRDFLVAHGGRAYTRNLIDHFSGRCRSEEAREEFKAAIAELATLTRGASNGRGLWTLKDDFRP